MKPEVYIIAIHPGLEAAKLPAKNLCLETELFCSSSRILNRTLKGYLKVFTASDGKALAFKFDLWPSCGSRRYLKPDDATRDCIRFAEHRQDTEAEGAPQ